jgi:hypothetical protein
VVNTLLKAHRSLFVFGTTVLAIAGSLVAADASDASNWVMLVGGATTMYSSDIFGDVDGAARRLAHTSRQQESQARSDLYRWRAPRHVMPTFIVGVLLIAVSIAMRADLPKRLW